MAGVFGVASDSNIVPLAMSGIFYLQNRAEDYCGVAWKKDDSLNISTHKGLIKSNYTKEKINTMSGNYAIASVSGNREPVSEFSKNGGMILCLDGNIANYTDFKNTLLMSGASFSGYHNPGEVCDTVLVTKMISRSPNFEKGIEKVVNEMTGDFSLVALTLDGIYASRGFGRKPLVLGRKNGSYAVSSESVSFVNTGFEIVRDVKPGETVLISSSGIKTTQQLDLSPEKFGTFEWIYTAHPASIIDGRSVEIVRNKIGRALARRHSIEADLVSPIPNSGRCYADGYSAESGIPHAEVFKKFDYSGRSFTPSRLEDQHFVANEKLIPIKSLIQGKRIILLDDSIVKGNQTRKQTQRLRDLGAKEVHARIACPPLRSACSYGKALQNKEDCVANKMSIEEIRISRGLDSLEYATIEDLEESIGMPKEKLCLECWQL